MLRHKLTTVSPRRFTFAVLLTAAENGLTP